MTTHAHSRETATRTSAELQQDATAAIETMLSSSIHPAEGEGLATDLHVMAGAIISEDGTAAFCDATGKVLYKPVSGWIGFMAHRLWFQARQEMARQLGDPDLGDDERTALQERLRRELRTDALAILAHRHDEAFRLALASETDLPPIPPARQYSAGTVSPEIVRAVEAHREASQLFIHDPAPDSRRRTHAERRVRALKQAICDTPARSLADLRHKLIYLWPGGIDEYVTHGGVAEIVQSLHDDALQLAEDAVSTELAAPDGLSSAGIDELQALTGVANLVSELAAAILCQPRCDDFPLAGALVERVNEIALTAAAAGEKEAARRATDTLIERRTRLEMMAASVIANGDREETAALAREVAALVEV